MPDHRNAGPSDFLIFVKKTKIRKNKHEIERKLIIYPVDLCFKTNYTN